MKKIGLTFLAIAILLLIVGITFDTTVSSGVGSTRTYNIGLINTQNNIFLFAGVTTVVGILLIGFGQNSARSKGTQPSPGRATRKCPYCAESILAEAVLCRHCNRESPAQINPIPSYSNIPLYSDQPLPFANRVRPFLLVTLPFALAWANIYIIQEYLRTDLLSIAALSPIIASSITLGIALIFDYFRSDKTRMIYLVSAVVSANCAVGIAIYGGTYFLTYHLVLPLTPFLSFVASIFGHAWSKSTKAATSAPTQLQDY